MSLLLDALHKNTEGGESSRHETPVPHEELNAELSLEPLQLEGGGNRSVNGSPEGSERRGEFEHIMAPAASAGVEAGMNVLSAAVSARNDRQTEPEPETTSQVRKWWQGQLGRKRWELIKPALYVTAAVLLAGGGLVVLSGLSGGGVGPGWLSLFDLRSIQPPLASLRFPPVAAGAGDSDGSNVNDGTEDDSPLLANPGLSSASYQGEHPSTPQPRSERGQAVRGHQSGEESSVREDPEANESLSSSTRREVPTAAGESVAKASVAEAKPTPPRVRRAPPLTEGEGWERTSAPTRAPNVSDRPANDRTATQQALVKIESDPANKLRVKAEEAVSQGNWQEAERAYLDWLQLRPGEPIALAGLAVTLHRQQRWAEAWQAYQRAAQRWPENLALRSGALAVLARLDPMMAESRLRDWLAGQPGDAVAHATLGVLLARQQRWAQALESLQKAVTLAPDDASIHYNLAVVLDRLQRVEAAIQHYRQSLALADPAIPRDVVVDRVHSLTGISSDQSRSSLSVKE